MSEDVAIKVRGLTTAYGTHTVHEELDLDVIKGEVLGVIGPSGTGKSVLLRAIVGLKRPETGTVEVFGKNVTVVGRPSTTDQFENEEGWTIDSLDEKLGPYFAEREPGADGFAVPPTG